MERQIREVEGNAAEETTSHIFNTVNTNNINNNKKCCSRRHSDALCLFASCNFHRNEALGCAALIILVKMIKCAMISSPAMMVLYWIGCFSVLEIRHL